MAGGTLGGISGLGNLFDFQATTGNLQDVLKGDANSKTWADLIDVGGFFHDIKPQTPAAPPAQPGFEEMATEAGAGEGGSGATTFEEMYQNLLKYAPQLQAQYLSQSKEYLPQYQQLAQQLLSANRQANLTDAMNLAPQYQQLEQIAQGNNVYNMRKTLGDQIYKDLLLGSQLDPETQRLAEQYSRSADLSRGVMAGSGSANREAVAKALSGNALKQQRQQAAQNFGTWENTQRYDPLTATMSMPTNTFNAAYGSLEQPYNQMTNLNASTLQAQAQKNQANQFQQSLNQQNALINAQMQMAQAQYANQGI